MESSINNGSTGNVCALDLSNTFDRMNYYVLLTNIICFPFFLFICLCRVTLVQTTEDK